MLNNLHTNWKYGSYENDRDSLIRSKENDGFAKTGIHNDGFGRAAIGYGYDLLAQNITTIKSDFSAIGLALSVADEKLITQYKNGEITLNKLINDSTLQMTKSQGEALYNNIISRFETQVDTVLGFSISTSRERATLVSLAYNAMFTSAKSPSLIKAIKDDNRAEAWFHIRYASNGGVSESLGIADRRIQESDIFGLYDTGSIDDESAKEVMRMYTLHKPDIEKVETKYSALYGESNKSTSQIDSAKNYLISNFAQDIDIGGRVIVGVNSVNDTYQKGVPSGNINDYLKGTDKNDFTFEEKGKNDLIFGEKGKDVLIGGAGSDVLYGGEDDDILVGNINGPAINDEADYLDGGEGKDTYVTAKDDRIHDSDGKGLIYFNNIDLTGTKTKMKDAENIYEDDDFTYQEIEGKLLVISRTNGESITIDNWSEVVKTTDKKKEALGIILQESQDIVASVLNDDQAFEAEEKMLFNVGLDRELLSGEVVVVKLGYNRANYAYVPVGDKVWIPPRPVVTTRYRDSYTGEWHTVTSGGGGYWYQPTTSVLTGYTFISYGEVTYKEGEQEKIFTYTWTDDSWPESNWSQSFIPHIDEERSHYAE
ncbi:MAG: hypothetical protein JXK50_06500, partial [Campylobacterales bacterium]|nr:hypothetical protein [Campylobacterales bacterium]